MGKNKPTYNELYEEVKKLRAKIEITDDISARKVREINLEESEIRFRNLAESTPIGILIYQGEYFVYANPSCKKITGYEPEELYRMQYWDLVDKEHRSLIIERGRKRQAGEEVPSEYQFQFRTKSGEEKWILINGCRINYRGKPAGMITVADITERKLTEDQLEENEEKYRALSDASFEAIFISEKGICLEQNEMARQMFGYTDEEVIGRPGTDWVVPEDRDLVMKHMLSGDEKPYEMSALRKDGSTFPCLIQARMMHYQERNVRVTSLRDTTEQKLANKVLLARLHLSEYAASHSLDELLTKTLDEAELLTGSQIGFYHFLETDQRTLSLQAWSTNTLAHLCTAEVKGQHYDIDKAGVWVDCVRQGKPVIHNDYASLPHRKGMPDGHAVVIRELVVPVFRGSKIVAILGVGNKSRDYDSNDIEIVSKLADIAWDIAEHKRADEALKLSEDRYRKAFATSPDSIAITRASDGVFVSVNEGFIQITGYTREDVIGKSSLEINIWKDPADRQKVVEGLKTNGEVRNYEAQFLIKNGQVTGLMSAAIIELNGVPHILNITRDISDRKRAEEKINRLNRTYAVLSNINQAIVRIHDMQSLWDEICRLSVEYGKFQMAWIGIVNAETKKVEIAASASQEDNPLEKMEIDIGRETDSVCPTGTAILSGAHIVCNDIENLSGKFPWRDIAIKSGYKSLMSLPLTISGSIFGAFSLYSDEVDFFDEDEVKLLDELGTDISFAIEFIENDNKRKEGEKALLEERGLFIGGATVVFKWQEKEGWPVEYVSPNIFSQFGYSVEDFISGKILFENIVHPDDLERIRDEVNQYTASGILSFEQEYRIVRPDGEYRWLYDFTVAKHNDEGIITHYHGYVHDITERKHANNVLTESEKRYRNLFETSPSGILLLDETGKIIEANDAITKSTLFSHEELIGNNILMLTLPEEHHFVKENIRKILSGQVLEQEVGTMRKDGTHCIFMLRETAMTLPSGERGILSVSNDITDYKKAEEAVSQAEKRYKALIEKAPDGIVMISDGKFKYSSPSGYVMFGYKKEELINLKPNELTHPEDLPMVLDTLAKMIEDPSTVPTLQYRFLHKNGSWRWIESTFSNLIDEPAVNAIVINFRDITESKKAEEALKHSELQYRTLFEGANDAIFLMSEDKFIECNEMTLIMFGCNKKRNIIDHHPWEFSPPAQPDGQKSTEKAMEYISAALKGKPQRFYWKHTRKSGEEFDAEVSLSLLQLEKESYLQAIVRDITERKKVELALRESEARYRLLADHMSDTVWLMDMNLKTIYISPSVEKLRGFSLKEIQEMSLDKHLIKESLWKALAIFSEEIEKVKVDPAYSFIRNIELEFSKKDGTTVWLESSFSVIRDEAGIPISILGEGRDITERKKIEHDKERDRQIQKTLNEILRLSTGGTGLDEYLDQVLRLMLSAPFIKVQQKGCIFLSDVHKEVLILRSQYNLPAPLQTMCKNVPFGHCLCGRAASERNIQFSDGTSEIHENNLLDNSPHGHYSIPIITDDIVLGVILIYLPEAHQKEQYEIDFYQAVADILCGVIQRKYTEEALVKAKDRAEASDKLKTAFLNNISHELRTPLNGILGFAEIMIQDELTDEDKQEYFGILNDNSERLLSTVTNYMDTSLIASGNMEVKHAAFNINQLVLSLDEKYQPHCTKKNLELQLQLPANTDNFSITSDKELIRKILILLLDNAVKFTSKGSISLGYEKKPAEIKFFVKDTGIGIPKDARERVFERFIQGEVSNTRGYEGSGLGLFLAKGMVELLGGIINMESAFDKGSTFYFTIPVEDGIHNIPDKSSPKIMRSQKKNPTILIAEDDHYNYLFLETVLRTASVRILHAVNGVEAIDMCIRYPEISLVLMDIKMPVMNGLEATKRIKATRSDLPIIAVTAYALSSDESLARRAGCDDYLAKPLTKDQLFEKINKYIEI